MLAMYVVMQIEDTGITHVIEKRKKKCTAYTNMNLIEIIIRAGNKYNGFISGPGSL